MLKYSLLIALIVLLQSCISTQDMLDGDMNNSDSGNSFKLDGTFSNQSDSLGISLQTLLNKPLAYEKAIESANDSLQVQFELLTDKKLKVSFVDNGIVIDDTILKGKIQSRFFIVKRKVRLIGIPLIWFSYRELVIILGIQNNNLMVKLSSHDFQQVLVLFAGEKDKTVKSKFRRMN